MEENSFQETSNLVEFPKVFINSDLLHSTNKINNFPDNTFKNMKENLNKNPKSTSLTNIEKNNNEKFITFENINDNSQSAKNTLKKIKISKLLQINFSKISSILEKFQKINFNDPLIKYIKYYIPYVKIKCRIEKITPSNNFINENKSFIDEIKKLSINRQKLISKNSLLKPKIPESLIKKEKPLNFKNSSNCLNYFCSRMYNNDLRINNQKLENKIILIQKNIRSFMTRKKFYDNLERLILEKFIDNILIIQKYFRRFLAQKNFYKNKIIGIIENERKNKANKLIDLFSMYHLRNYYKKKLIIKKILLQRQKKIILIQSHIRKFLIKLKINELFYSKKNSFEITFPNINTIKNVYIKIYKNRSTYKIFDFHLCPLRRIFVSYINKNELLENQNLNKNFYEFICHFFVNGRKVIDNRFKVVKNKKGIKFNLVRFKNEKQITDIVLKNEQKKTDDNVNNYNFQNKKIVKIDIVNHYLTNFRENKKLKINKIINSTTFKQNNSFSKINKNQKTSIFKGIYKRKIPKYKTNHTIKENSQNRILEITIDKSNLKNTSFQSDNKNDNSINATKENLSLFSYGISEPREYSQKKSFISSYYNYCNQVKCGINNNIKKSLEESSYETNLANSISTVSTNKIYKKIIPIHKKFSIIQNNNMSLMRNVPKQNNIKQMNVMSKNNSVF